MQTSPVTDLFEYESIRLVGHERDSLLPVEDYLELQVLYNECYKLL